jgi:hypothetical protein
MILLGFIILGHPDWKKTDIRIFDVCPPDLEAESRIKMKDLIKSGRLPVTSNNIEIIPQDHDLSTKKLVNDKSGDAGLVILGFHEDSVKKGDTFNGFDKTGTILFVNSHNDKVIE